MKMPTFHHVALCCDISTSLANSHWKTSHSLSQTSVPVQSHRCEIQPTVQLHSARWQKHYPCIHTHTHTSPSVFLAGVLVFFWGHGRSMLTPWCNYLRNKISISQNQLSCLTGCSREVRLKIYCPSSCEIQEQRMWNTGQKRDGRKKKQEETDF